MKKHTCPKLFFVLLILLALASSAQAQQEVLTNADIIQMSQVGLSKQIIINKINTSEGRYDASAKALIELKKAQVTDEVITALLENIAATKQTETEIAPNAEIKAVVVDKKTRSSAEVLRAAKTVALRKDSIHPTLQALQKELLKRPDWQNLNLNITQQQYEADLLVEIGRVRFSIVTHRYVFRVYDNKTGIVIAAGETTSWGSLAENMAREISKKLTQTLARK